IVKDVTGFTGSWIVVAHGHFDDDGVLLLLDGVLSRVLYAADVESRETTAWSNSVLRAYFRGEFYAGLSDEFRNHIVEVTTETNGFVAENETVFALSPRELGNTSHYVLA